MTELYRMINGKPFVSTEGLAVLIGIPVEQLRAEYAKQQAVGFGGSFHLPADWAQAGVRRRKECAAALGYEPSMKESIDYWAARA